MKYLCILTACIMLFTNNIFASTCNPNYPYDKEVSLPFKDQAANNGKYDDGICFRYQLNTNSTKAIICKLTNFNIGWMLYTENGIAHDSNTHDSFAGNATITLTATGKTESPAKNVYQYHVDDKSYIVFHHDINYDSTTKSHPTISCSYTN